MTEVSPELQRAQMQCQMDTTEMQQNMEKAIEASNAGNNKLADTYIDQMNAAYQNMQSTLKDALSKTEKGTDAYAKLQQALQDMTGEVGAPGLGQAFKVLKDLGDGSNPIINPVVEPITPITLGPINFPPDDKV